MLNDTKVKNLKPQSKEYFAPDYGGLRLAIEPCGSKLWQHRFRIKQDGKLKEKVRSGGKYPEVSLLEARAWRDENNRLRKEGKIPPKVYDKFNQVSSDVTTFKDVFDMWHSSMSDWSEGYAIDTQQRANMYLLPLLGDRRIDEINTKLLIDLLLEIQNKGVLDTVQKIKGILNRVFSYAVNMQIINSNPAREISNDLFKKKKESRYAFVSEPKDIKWLLSMLKQVNSGQSVTTALELAPHLFLRAGELVGLRWSEIDFEEKLIRLPASRMKIDNKPHTVPMSNIVIEILTTLKNSNLDSTFCFPSSRSKARHITTNSLLASMRSVGIDKEVFTTHGMRHMASTRLNEMGGYNSDAIEIQLAHAIPGVRGVYDQSILLDQRKILMEDWSNYLNDLVT